MIDVRNGRRAGSGLTASRIACRDPVIGPAKWSDEMVKVPCRMRRAEPDLKGQRNQREPRAEPTLAGFALGPAAHGGARDCASLPVSTGGMAVKTWALRGMGKSLGAGPEKTQVTFVTEPNN